MKNRIMLAAALLAVMITMTGIAAALEQENSISVDPGVVVMDAGGTATQKVTVTSADGTITSLKVSGVGFKLEDKFTVKIDGVENTQVTGNWSSPKKFVVTFMDGKGDSGKDFTVSYEATFMHGSITKEAKIQTDIKVKPTPIPEFPNVALPIATIIGLVLLFQYRNKR